MSLYEVSKLEAAFGPFLAGKGGGSSRKGLCSDSFWGSASLESRRSSHTVAPVFFQTRSIYIDLARKSHPEPLPSSWSCRWSRENLQEEESRIYSLGLWLQTGEGFPI